MSYRAFLTQFALVCLQGFGAASDAAAAAQRTFVASTGSDSNPCSLALPCRSFLTAIGQTLAGGEVIVVDSAGYGPVTISQPVSIIAPPGVYAGVSVFNGIGIDVNPGSGKVTLRGLTISGLGGTTGIAYQSGAALYVDGVVVTGFGPTASSAGIDTSLAASGSVFISNSVFRDNGVGASFTASSGTVTLSIERSLFERNGTGADLRNNTTGTVQTSTFSAGTDGILVHPTAGSARLEVRDCTLSDNTGTGITAGDVGPTPTYVSVVSSLLSGNGGTAVLPRGGNEVYLSDTTITRNVTGIGTASGTVVSGGDNRLLNNGTNGTFTSTTPKL